MFLSLHPTNNPSGSARGHFFSKKDLPKTTIPKSPSASVQGVVSGEGNAKAMKSPADAVGPAVAKFAGLTRF
jgi:hypothetical protein